MLRVCKRGLDNSTSVAHLDNKGHRERGVVAHRQSHDVKLLPLIAWPHTPA